MRQLHHHAWSAAAAHRRRWLQQRQRVASCRLLAPPSTPFGTRSPTYSCSTSHDSLDGRVPNIPTDHSAYPCCSCAAVRFCVSSFARC
ncbi:hypothetical protein ACP4OV_007069 [Aristida adscensionis]